LENEEGADEPVNVQDLSAEAPSAFIPTQGTPEATAFLFKQFQGISFANLYSLVQDSCRDPEIKTGARRVPS
jgi:hypothetical protein